MGLAIGYADGLYERSGRKLRNGLLGGAAGGFLGGLLFDLVARSGTGMASRAVAFVVLGLAIGLLIGLAQVVLKDAWLTVLDGFRPGRQLILSQAVTVLGRGDGTCRCRSRAMPAATWNRSTCGFCRQPDGNFTIEDNHSRLGTLLGGQRINGPTPLRDGDVIRLGSNLCGSITGMPRPNRRGHIPAGRRPPARRRCHRQCRRCVRRPCRHRHRLFHRRRPRPPTRAPAHLEGHAPSWPKSRRTVLRPLCEFPRRPRRRRSRGDRARTVCRVGLAAFF